MATAEANIQNKIRTGKKVSKDENLEDYVESLDENADVAHESIKAEEIKRSSEEDLESLLKLAEDIKEKIESPRVTRQIFFNRIIQGLFTIMVLPDVISFFFKGQFIFSNMLEVAGEQGIIKITILMMYISLPLFVISLEFTIRRIKKDTLPDKLALKEVLQLLREVHGTIAEREDWSVLKRAEFRIRLSRFDLSEKKVSVFSFFS